MSPDDLRAAVERFAPLRLPLIFRTFPSGVAVVQDESWSDDAACERIVALLTGTGLGAGLRPAQLAAREGMPVAVAKEQLLMAERVGMVCRDDAAEGLTFYRNFFTEVAPL